MGQYFFSFDMLKISLPKHPQLILTLFYEETNTEGFYVFFVLSVFYKIFEDVWQFL